MSTVAFICIVKILILHQHFKTPQSGGAIRSYYLGKALVDNGHRVVVIATHNQKTYLLENVEGIEVHYLPIAYDNGFRFYARVWSFVRYILSAVQLAGRFKDFDYCYAISVPLTIGIVAMRIKQRFNIPYIFEVGDLWPEAPVQMGFVNNFFLKKALYRLEKLIYKRARAVVGLSPAIKASIEKTAPGKKVFMIPNMADTEFYKPEVRQPTLEKKYGVEGKLVVSYIGALGVANGLDYFLECARAAQKAEMAVHFLLCGDGAMLDYLKKTTIRLQLKNLSIIPFQVRDGVAEVMNVTDVMFVSYKPVPVLETGSPNKFFDGLAGGKMIVVNFGGWIRKEIEANQCGLYIESNNPADFVKKMNPVVTNKDLLRNYQTASRALAEKKYSRAVLSNQFVSVFAN